MQTPPASWTIRLPAAKSHMWIPNSKFASAPPSATIHIFRAAEPRVRTLRKINVQTTKRDGKTIKILSGFFMFTFPASGCRRIFGSCLRISWRFVAKIFLIIWIIYPWTFGVRICTFSNTVFIFSGSLLVPISIINRAFDNSVNGSKDPL